MQLSTAFGKSTLLQIHADATMKLNPDRKLIITVPNEVLKQVVLSKCIHKSENPLDIEDQYSTGVFVVSYKELMALPNRALNMASLLIDEFHRFCELDCKLVSESLQSKLLKMDQAANVIGVSATLGSEQSKNFIVDNIEDSQIIDLKLVDKDNMNQSIVLDVIPNCLPWKGSIFK